MAKKQEVEDVLDLHNKVSPKELYEIIKTNVKSLIDNPESSSKIPPMFVWGGAGVGKSTIIRSVADDLGIGFIDFRLAQREPVDMRGLPVPNKETHTVEWYVTSDFPSDPNSKGIILFDELPAADSSLQIAAFEIILDRRLGKLYSLPNGWYVIAAGNRTTDHAGAKSILSPLANRFLHIELDTNSEDWVLWAQQHDIHPSVIGFINYRNEYLFHMEHENLERGWPSPRSWERVSHILNLYSSLDPDSPVLRKLVYGLVGNRAGVEFIEFFKNNAQFDNVLEYMLNPNLEFEIPDRADARYAVVSSMNYLLWRGKDDEDQKKRIDGFFRISMRLPADFAALAMLSAMAGNSKKMEAYCADTLFHHPRYKEWAKKYGSAIRKRFTI
jgi:hypothetical protein